MSRRSTIVAALATLPFVSMSLPAQQVSRLAQRPDVRALLDSIKANNDWTLQQQVGLCEIPAPPFKEQARGAAYKAAFEKLGLTNVRVDSAGNVIGERRGSASGPVVVIAGHLDTVFPEGTDVTVKREGDRYVGRGIGDDCRGLAVVLSVARALQANPVATKGTIVFVGDVGEEGPGNLRGMRHLFATGQTSGAAGQKSEGLPKIDYFISVDGAGNGITSRAVGSHRYKVHYKGPGGHSYGAFGNPNPAHALGRAMAAIADFQVPASPKTTFNVGVIEGGTSVNSIPFEASMEFDMRSESAQSLDALDAKAQRAFRAALAAENARWPKSRYKLTMQIDTIGIRPTGGQPDSAPIVRVAEEAGKTLGFSPRLGASSTDANIPISLGIPAITIDGGGTGGGAHGLDEWYSDGPEGWVGPQWAAMIVLGLVM
jgi:acetylornithine deacetylase/succinyl-diaminopimelate desuccinylase-like protein